MSSQEALREKKKKEREKKKKKALITRDVAKPRSGIPKSLRGRFFYGKFYVGKSFFLREILRGKSFFFPGNFEESFFFYGKIL